MRRTSPDLLRWLPPSKPATEEPTLRGAGTPLRCRRSHSCLQSPTTPRWISGIPRKSSVGGKGSTELVVKGLRREVSEEFAAELKDILRNNLTLDFEERFFHGKPQNSFRCTGNAPDVIFFPRDFVAKGDYAHSKCPFKSVPQQLERDKSR